MAPQLQCAALVTRDPFKKMKYLTTTAKLATPDFDTTLIYPNIPQGYPIWIREQITCQIIDQKNKLETEDHSGPQWHKGETMAATATTP